VPAPKFTLPQKKMIHHHGIDTTSLRAFTTYLLLHP
jgi:hypothetical protein